MTTDQMIAVSAAVFAGLSAVFAAVSIRMSLKQAREQGTLQEKLTHQTGDLQERLTRQAGELQERLTRETGELQKNLTRETEALTLRLNEDESTAEGRRYFTVLWDKMNKTMDIDPDEVIPVHVRDAINVMSFVALCWQAGIVDKKMCAMAFGDFYERQYIAIQKISQPIGKLNGNGPQLLQQGREIGVVLEEIRVIRNEQGKL